jgi:hypothetical protein
MTARKKAKPVPTKTVLTVRDIDALDLIDERLKHGSEIMAALNYIMEQEDANLQLGGLAVAARELIVRVRDDLMRLRRQAGAT